MCEKLRSISFRESFRGVDYGVMATSSEDNVEISLPEFGDFESLVKASGLVLSSDEIKALAAEEYEKCLLGAIRRLKGGLE